MDVQCKSCGKPVEKDEGFTCRACRLMIKTPFRMRVPSFSELAKSQSEPPAKTRFVLVFATITLGLPVLMSVAYWVFCHYFR